MISTKKNMNEKKLLNRLLGHYHKFSSKKQKPSIHLASSKTSIVMILLMEVIIRMGLRINLKCSE